MTMFRNTELQLQGGKRPRKVRVRRNSFTKAKQQKFIDVLSDTCNITLAAEKASVSQSYVYTYAGKDAAFAAAWEDAKLMGYEKNEFRLIDRAINGHVEEVWHQGECKGKKQVFSERTALHLFDAHRDAVKATRERRAVPQETAAEKRDWLANKLIEMGQRLDMDENTNGVARDRDDGR